MTQFMSDDERRERYRAADPEMYRDVKGPKATSGVSGLSNTVPVSITRQGGEAMTQTFEEWNLNWFMSQTDNRVFTLSEVKQYRYEAWLASRALLKAKAMTQTFEQWWDNSGRLLVRQMCEDAYNTGSAAAQADLDLQIARAVRDEIKVWMHNCFGPYTEEIHATMPQHRFNCRDCLRYDVAQAKVTRLEGEAESKSQRES